METGVDRLSDLLSVEHLSGETPDLLNRTFDAALRYHDGRRRIERKSFWDAAKDLVGGISLSRKDLDGRLPHMIFPADKIAVRHGVDDKRDRDELRLLGAEASLWLGSDPRGACRFHAVVGENAKHVSEIYESIKKMSPQARRAMIDVYEHRPAGSAIYENFYTGQLDISEEERRLITMRAAAFSIQRGCFADGIIQLHGVFDDADKDAVRFQAVFQAITEGSTASEAINRHRMTNEKHINIMKQLGMLLDIREGMSEEEASQRNDITRPEDDIVYRYSSRPGKRKVLDLRDGGPPSKRLKVSHEHAGLSADQPIDLTTEDGPRGPKEDFVLNPRDRLVRESLLAGEGKVAGDCYILNSQDELVPEKQGTKRLRSVTPETPSKGTKADPIDLTEPPRKIARGLDLRSSASPTGRA